MKRRTLGLTILLSAALLTVGCGKKAEIVVPDDSKLQATLAKEGQTQSSPSQTEPSKQDAASEQKQTDAPAPTTPAEPGATPTAQAASQAQAAAAPTAQSATSSPATASPSPGAQPAAQTPAAATPPPASAHPAAAQKSASGIPLISFGQFFDGDNRTTPSNKFWDLKGQKVEIKGYMGEVLSMEKHWFLLIPQPGAECPFDNDNGKLWNEIMIVFVPDSDKLRHTTGPLKVTGTLDVGIKVDQSGYRTMFRLQNASFEKM